MLKNCFEKANKKHGFAKLLGISFFSLLILINLSSAAPFAYITNQFSDSLSIIDTSTDTVVDTLNLGSFPWGVAVDTSGTRVYVTNAGSNTVSVINATDNTVIATLK